MTAISTYDVEKAARKLRKFTPTELALDMQCLTYVEVNDVLKNLRDLRQLKIIRDMTGPAQPITRKTINDIVLVYIGNDDRNGRLINKIYRAMHIRGVFSRGEVIKLSGVHKSTVRRAFVEIEGRREIERIGTGRSSKGAEEVRYRVCDPDGFYLRHVK